MAAAPMPATHSCQAWSSAFAWPPKLTWRGIWPLLPQAARPAPLLPALPAGTVNYVQQLGLPVLSLGLGAAMAAGLALPGALVGAAVLAATIPHARRAVNGLREEKRPTVEILDVTAVALLVAQSSFLAPAFMISVIEGAEVVRSWTTRRGRQAGVDLLLSQKRQALVEREGQQVRVGYEELAPGDIVLVYPGDEIPVDGKVLDGSASIDQHRMTGDPAPVVRQQGDEVYAATVVVEGHLHILATHTGLTTHTASLIALAEAAPKPDTRVSNYARKTGNPAVVPTLAIGGAIWAASGSIGRAAGIASLDMGLGIRVSAPIAILTAQNDAARHGIVIRGGRALEMLAQADTFLFDKTATLTDRVGVVIEVQSLAPDASPHGSWRWRRLSSKGSTTRSPRPLRATPSSRASRRSPARTGTTCQAREWWRRSPDGSSMWAART